MTIIQYYGFGQKFVVITVPGSLELLHFSETGLPMACWRHSNHSKAIAMLLMQHSSFFSLCILGLFSTHTHTHTGIGHSLLH